MSETAWTSARLKHWRRLFNQNAREGYEREPTEAEHAEAERLREMGLSPHRAAARVYTTEDRT